MKVQGSSKLLNLQGYSFKAVRPSLCLLRPERYPISHSRPSPSNPKPSTTHPPMTKPHRCMILNPQPEIATALNPHNHLPNSPEFSYAARNTLNPQVAVPMFHKPNLNPKPQSLDPTPTIPEGLTPFVPPPSWGP